MAKHAMVIGGTGMLKEATLWLEQNGYHVSLIARTRKRLESVREQATGASTISIYSVDYHDDKIYGEIIGKALDDNGPVDLVVNWTHSSAPKAIQTLVQTIEQKQANEWHLFHVKGSTKQLPTLLPDLPKQCIYHQVFLGFIIEGDCSRWLTNHEISGGTIHAIKENKKVHIVGTLEPWDRRP